jgi:hypothetical protein
MSYQAMEKHGRNLSATYNNLLKKCGQKTQTDPSPKKQMVNEHLKSYPPFYVIREVQIKTAHTYQRAQSMGTLTAPTTSEDVG